MARRLPPLNAVRAFESAAKHQSFTKAAEELHVTPSAISRHVMQLESRLGVNLFSRRQRRIHLTDNGRRYAAGIEIALDQIDAVTRLVSDHTSDRNLRIKLMPTIAFRWLLPRILPFQAKHPEFMIQIATTMDEVDLAGDEADITILNAKAPRPDMVSDWLFDEVLIPVCSPSVSLCGPLQKQTLLTALSRPRDWPVWFAGAGLSEPGGLIKLDFQYSFLAYEAAISGGGIAIAIKELVQDDLQNRKLTIAFEPAVRTGRAYFLVSTVTGATRPAVSAFRDWVREVCGLPLDRLPLESGK
ncbi:MAG: LysR family transcriptional regulator [Burkholderiales bacterium]|nr:LysR family transcriptional regulator [Burkholderiales bacterium]